MTSPSSPWPPADVESLPDREREVAELADAAFSEADRFGLAVLLTYPQPVFARVTPEET